MGLLKRATRCKHEKRVVIQERRWQVVLYTSQLENMKHENKRHLFILKWVLVEWENVALFERV